jgi:hypothetical protein
LAEEKVAYDDKDYAQKTINKVECIVKSPQYNARYKKEAAVVDATFQAGV